MKNIVCLDFDNSLIRLVDTVRNEIEEHDVTPIDEDTLYATFKGLNQIVDYIVLKDGTKIQCLIHK